ncbi:glutathione synthase [Buchnera aphidicola (Thelaxes californica)]|uniref:Glutathione synthetase n=1 Tax=Buchnera aphidicola (Thelaxes californica) TaxID=1315998 RepID=A0A4D6YAR0_9GAMM|nr:glutathione synthase [Buchnera aphidicola]QCI26947.1 glutathione synthase [Buchnera aphidicola (Thelaxes californica)]
MHIKIGVIMDPIQSINIKKDSTFPILLEMQKRKYIIFYMEIKDLYWKKGETYSESKILHVYNNKNKWFKFIEKKEIKLSDLNVIFMRKDPPINLEFIYATYLLEFAEKKGVFIFNKPSSLRNCNEKIFTCNFKNLIPETMITKKIKNILNFLQEHKNIIIKPLNEMGGASVFKICEKDVNTIAILENMTHNESKSCMIQKFIPEIKDGDKRILVIDGIPIPICLARIPKNNEIRGNLARGGKGKIEKLNEHDQKIIKKISPILKKNGLLFVGIDIIGKYLTEINITSPTCIQEIQKEYHISIPKIIVDCIEKKINQLKIKNNEI